MTGFHFRELAPRLLLKLCVAAAAYCVVGQAWAQEWPSAASDPNLKAMIEQGNYTAEERRNIDTLLEVLSDPQGLEPPHKAKHFCEEYTLRGRRPYETLYRAYGKPDGINANSFTKLRREVKDILAQGDRVWADIHTTANHTGKVFGVAGKGGEIRMYEKSFFKFDKDGKLCQARRMVQEAELYRQLGGKFKFPIDKGQAR